MTEKTRPATPESVWKILREVGELQKQNQKERERMAKEHKADQKKTEVSLRELRKSLDKASGNFNNKWGQFMERLIQGDLLKLLGERGIAVEKILPKVCLGRPDKSIAMEFDLIAVNGEEVVVVEVKTTLTGEKIDKFVKRLKNFRDIFPEYNDKKIYGCVAYLGEHKESVKESLANGLFVIQALGRAGHLSTIVNPLDFRPQLF